MATPKRNTGKMPRVPQPAGQRLANYARSELHEAGMDLFDFFETMMNPEDLPPMRVPDSHAGRTAVFKTPLVVDLPFSGVWDPSGNASADIAVPAKNGYSEVILIPGTVDCILHTMGGADTTLFAGGSDPFHALVPMLATHPVLSDVINGRTQILHGLRSYNGVTNNVAILPKISANGHAIYECEIISDSVGVDTISMEFDWQNQGPTGNVATTFHVTVILRDGQEITNFGSALSGVNSVPIIIDWSALGLNDAAGTIRGFFVEVEDLDSAASWVFSLTDAAYSLAAVGKSACSFTILNTPELDSLSETLSERTTALTGLCTFMGSTLEDGGQISAARLGMGLSPLRAPLGDVYSYLASLPFYNDDFPLRDGIYTWWCPDSIQEHFYVPYRVPRSDNLEENSVLQIAVLRDDPDQAVRLKVIQNVEVITRSRLYTARSSPVNPTYASMIGAIKSIPAVTVNAKHPGILSKALGFVKGWVSKPANFRKLLKGGTNIVKRIAPGIF